MSSLINSLFFVLSTFKGTLAGVVIVLMIVGLIGGILLAIYFLPKNVNVPTVSNLINPLFK
jgi:hypothetical protein